ncbi:MAG: tyrosine-type recombinase/integrase, partial [Pseudolabrys sp.]
FLPLFEGKRFNWHGLRHFAVSTWIEAGLAPKTVQTFAGHASLQVTMDRYGHMFPSDDHRRAMDQIAKGLFKNG